tara:strand:- start:135 stop:323 length:189 start_codon:yes stop_codon:yes gene_type:complete
MKAVNTAQYVAPPIDASADPTIIKVTFVGNSIEHFVPIDTANTDYQVILAWVAAGNTIAEAD